MTGGPIHHRRDDQGGVWIVTGIVLAVLMYGFIILLDVAGFSEVLPLVILPPVVLGLIGANNLIGGGRSYGRSSARTSGPAPTPPPTGAPGSSGEGNEAVAAPSGPPRAEERPPSS